MNIALRRTVAATAIAMLNVAGVVATAAPGNAFEVSYSSWNSGTNVLLDAGETSAAIADGIYYTSSLCADAITRAVQSGIPFPDEARMACGPATIECAREARGLGNSLSGTQLFGDGRHRCLVR